MARDESKPVFIHYGRHIERVSVKLENVDENEIRAVLTALWLILEPSSRVDMIRELAHYHEAPDAHPPAVATAIADAYGKARGQ